MSDPPTRAQVAAHLGALNLTGLSFAAKRLLGKDPGPVVAQFTMWARQGAEGMPSLVQPFWQSLAPLGIGRPAGPAAALCDLLLSGRERDGDVALRAAADAAAEGKTRFRDSPLVTREGEDPAPTAALVDAVKAFWRDVAKVYGGVRAAIVDGDVARVESTLRRARDAMAPSLVTISDLATAVAATALSTAAVDDAETPGVEAEPRVEPPPLEDPPPVVEPPPLEEQAPLAAAMEETLHEDPAEARAAAFAQQHRVVAQPEPEARKVEVLSSKPPREHPFLPILFLLLVTAAAMYVVYTVLNDPTNPLR